MKLTHSIEIDETLKLTEIQGHKVTRSRSHLYLCKILVSAIILLMNDSILMILRQIIYIDETLKLTKVQGQKVKGQDRILQESTFGSIEMCICVKQTRLTYLRGVNVLVEFAKTSGTPLVDGHLDPRFEFSRGNLWKQ